jgi:hypothetical protein
MNRKLLFEVPLKGYFKLDGYGFVRNKFNRNMGYIIDGLLRLTNVTVYDEGGYGRTITTNLGGLLGSYNPGGCMGIPIFPQFGTSQATPTITDNNLASPDINLPTNYVDTVELTDRTQLLIASVWYPDVNKTYYEAGLKLLFDFGYNYACLLSRTIFESALSRVAFTKYFDGYVLEFPSQFTRWFINALCSAVSGHDSRQTRGRLAKDINGNIFLIRTSRAFSGSPDVIIGSNNTSPSPDDYNLKSPIASLGSQSQTVEVDTTNQEVRVVRTGSITPSSNITLGEIGLFCNLAGFSGGNSVTSKVMITRVALPSPITLYANTSYSLGIILRLT